MNPLRPIVLSAIACSLTLSLLTGCHSTQDARSDALENRIERQDDRIEARSDRRRRRAEAEDQRYNDWYNRVMGRPAGS